MNVDYGYRPAYERRLSDEPRNGEPRPLLKSMITVPA
jgi:hypothetical protein